MHRELLELDTAMKFNVADVLKALKENRDRHLTEFEQATVQFRRRLAEELERKLSDLRAGREVEPDSELVRPVHYVKTYDQAIKMLELCSAPEVELDADSFSKLMLDEGWQWRNSYNHKTRSYLGWRRKQEAIWGPAL